MSRRKRRLVIPKKFRLYGKNWRVRMEIQRRIGYDGSRRLPILGLCQYENNIIRLSKGQTRQSLEKTWVHELLHAMMPDHGLSHELEEKVVTCLTHRLYCAIMNDVLTAEDV